MLPAILLSSILFSGYVLFGYGVILRGLVFLKSKRNVGAPLPEREGAAPFVSIVVPCFNEEMNVGRKADNVFSTAYPKERFEVIFIDNSSTDNTFSLIEELATMRPIVVLKSRRGKIFALNAALQATKGEFIVSTDCDTEWEPDALRNLMAPFQNEQVGAVCAVPAIRHAIDATKERYHRGDWRIRALESELDTCSSLDGRLMAFRKSAIARFPEGSSVDDLELTILLREKKIRSVVADNVFICEESPANWREEFSQIRRRVYTVFKSLWNHRSMVFNPGYGAYGVLILPSRRLFPLFLPFALLAGFVSAALMWPKPSFVLALATAVLLLAFKITFLPLQFSAILFGWFDVLVNRRRGDVWCRTN